MAKTATDVSALWRSFNFSVTSCASRGSDQNTTAEASTHRSEVAGFYLAAFVSFFLPWRDRWSLSIVFGVKKRWNNQLFNQAEVLIERNTSLGSPTTVLVPPAEKLSKDYNFYFNYTGFERLCISSCRNTVSFSKAGLWSNLGELVFFFFLSQRISFESDTEPWIRGTSTNWAGSFAEPLTAISETQNRTCLNCYRIRRFQSLPKPARFSPISEPERHQNRCKVQREENGSHTGCIFGRLQTFFFSCYLTRQNKDTFLQGGNVCCRYKKQRMLEILLHTKKVQIDEARGKVRTSNGNTSGWGYSIKPDTEESTEHIGDIVVANSFFLMARKIWENVGWWVCVKSIMVPLKWSSILIWVNHNIEPICNLKAPQLDHISPKLLLKIKVNSAHEWLFF